MDLLKRSRLSEGGVRRTDAPFGPAAVVMLAALLFACAHPRSAQGGPQTFTWTGETDTNWNTPGNWEPEGGPPSDETHSAVINDGDDNITVPDIALGSLSLDTNYAGTVTLEGNLKISGDLTVSAGTLRTARDVESGITVDGAFMIGPGGVVVVRRSSTTANDGHGAGQTLTVHDLTVEGLLHADGQGFDASQGPGGGTSGRNTGSHGGRGGGDGRGGTNAVTYGSFANPVSLGSGSRGSGPGGGAVVIDASGTVTVDAAGIISADGTSGSRGAPGGSINITASHLEGAGEIRACGGPGDGAGGGGRIAFHVSGDDNFTGTIRADGGVHSNRGHAGTIYLSEQRRTNLVLGGADNMQTLRLGTDDNMGPGGDYNYEFGTITIKDGGRLEIDGNPRLNEVGGIAHGTSAVFEVGTLEIRDGGRLSADLLGFACSGGPGGGTSGDNTGSHGGRGGGEGGDGTDAVTYGSFENPVSLGSGSRGSGPGGGAVVIDASGTVNVAAGGIMSADGISGSRGAPGGSINITAAHLEGAGEIRACGGTGRGAGGGGRIAFHVSGDDNFTGTVRADGGGSPNRGHAGTIYLSGQRRANLVLGGAGNFQTLRLGTDDNMGPGGDYNYEFGTITVKDGGRLEIDGNPRTNEVGGIAHGTAAVFEVDALDVQEGGHFSADGLGFARDGGPGGGVEVGDGGSHGGRGGGRDYSGSFGPTYGVWNMPVTTGSGGEDSGSGGGAVIVVVDGTVNIGGTVSADGETAERGGSGGSVYISADYLTGDGMISASGGQADSRSGSGGGGRIALDVAGSDNFEGSIQVNGGGGGIRGHAGTIYFSEQRRANLVIGGTGNFQTLRLGADDNMGPGGDYNYEFGTITVNEGGLLEIDGNPRLNKANGVWQGTAAVLNTGALHVKNGAHISADNLGFIQNGGPGAGDHTGGGSHGGRGRNRDGFRGSEGPTYGSALNPTTLGSGGQRDGRGGGAVIIIVDGTLELEAGGVISADGEQDSRGGSGGTVGVVADVIVGEGLISATGGAGGGSGGGGRVSVILTVSDAMPEANIRAHGGGGSYEAAAGTVYVQHAAHGEGGGVLYISNPHKTAWSDPPAIVTELPSALNPDLHAGELAAVTLIVQDQGIVGLTADITVGDIYLETE